MISQHECVLFDLDGTLLNSLEDLAASMNTVLKNLGFAGHEIESYKYFVGDGMEPLARRALPASRQDDALLIDRCVKAMSLEYRQHWADKTRPYPGIPELLDALTAKQIKMVILSNKPHDFTCKIVEQLLSSWHFDVVMGAQATIPKKPDPAAALQLAAQLHIAAEKFLYAGDTSTDMRTATAAGMYPVGVLWGFRTADELIKSGAACLIEKPMELLRHL